VPSPVKLRLARLNWSAWLQISAPPPATVQALFGRIVARGAGTARRTNIDVRPAGLESGQHRPRLEPFNAAAAIWSHRSVCSIASAPFPIARATPVVGAR